jgi:hypothetical protein
MVSSPWRLNPLAGAFYFQFAGLLGAFPHHSAGQFLQHAPGHFYSPTAGDF